MWTTRASARRPRERVRRRVDETREPAAPVGARRVLVETPQHRVEHARAVVVRPHSVRQVDVDGRVAVGVFDQLTELAVDRRVDRADRIGAQGVELFGVVPRVRGVVHLPELVPDAMRLAEHREEEVPIALAEDIERQGALAPDALQHLGEEGPVLGKGAVLAGAVGYVARGVVRERRGSGPEPVRPVLLVDLAEERSGNERVPACRS